MAIARIGPKHQITIPEEAFQRLGLQAGEFLEVQVRGDVLYLVPQKLIPRDQAWFWGRQWQEWEQDADEAMAQGELSGPFESVDDLIHYLRSR
jgi:AbrB family looped-hinge helix DNA binding protein